MIAGKLCIQEYLLEAKNSLQMIINSKELKLYIRLHKRLFSALNNLRSIDIQ